MKEKIGYPYTTLPDNMFHHAAGGYAGQGTLCGSLGACSALINLVATDDERSHNQLIGDLINWYASYNHPTDEFDDIVKYPGQVRVVPGSMTMDSVQVSLMRILIFSSSCPAG